LLVFFSCFLFLPIYQFKKRKVEEGYEQIKFKFIGVSGVYKLINKNDPRCALFSFYFVSFAKEELKSKNRARRSRRKRSRFYIGSSNNLARRMDEYNKLTKGLRNPQSSAELEISKTTSAIE
jgi:hypothetical protein